MITDIILCIFIDLDQISSTATLNVALTLTFPVQGHWVISPPPVKPEGTIGLHSVRQSVCQSVRLSVRHTRFPDFSSLYFHISGWKLVQSFYMKSYRSSSTFVMVDLLFHELLPFVQNSFSGLFSVMLSHTWMKVCRKLPHEELQSKFNFCHGWPTFPWVIALCSKFVFRNGCRFEFVGVGGGPVLLLQ